MPVHRCEAQRGVRARVRLNAFVGEQQPYDLQNEPNY
jgi:hypothetical protein